LQGKLEEAIGAYRQAIAVQPAFPEAYNNLGNALREAGRAEEAVACYTACIQLQVAAAQRAAAGGGAAAAAAGAQHAQRLSVAYNNLAGILKMTARLPECIQCYEHVVYLQPRCPEAYANLGSAYKDSGRHDEAIACYRQALALRPDFPDALANLAHSLQCVCDWKDRPSLFARWAGCCALGAGGACMPPAPAPLPLQRPSLKAGPAASRRPLLPLPLLTILLLLQPLLPPPFTPQTRRAGWRRRCGGTLRQTGCPRCSPSTPWPTPSPPTWRCPSRGSTRSTASAWRSAWACRGWRTRRLSASRGGSACAWATSPATLATTR
jgi:Tfp pilus assembly protein PilF